MSKALKWLEAESDRLEKECNENNDPHKTVNHSFLEGFNYALLNAQDLEQIQLDDNQKIVLEYLKSKVTEEKVNPVNAIFILGHLWEYRRFGIKEEIKVADSYDELDSRQQALVIEVFSKWVQEQEEA
ncbi:hypothetical protein [Enterococcus faecium]|uniref:hypothetical protein n=1 Tax=Enterococcus faecium TaxID=1352 RepID=UPI000A338C7F|nr:hypothetical protein [Enterococcus faecium]OTN91125.1 hypothetical protein A5809_000489 [Enterococcus faecium]